MRLTSNWSTKSPGNQPAATSMSPPFNEARQLQQLFESQLDTIERVVAYTRTRHHLPKSEADDFASYVKLRLIEGDYAILRQFSGRSSLHTYLTIVVQRMLVDYQIGIWGKWRPSAEARRAGPVAILLERLLSRDGHSLGEACEILLTNHKVEASRAELTRLAERLPVRVRRHFETDDELDQLPGQLPSAEHQAMADESEQLVALVSRLLREALDGLADRDRLILKLRFQDGCKAAEIAALIGTSERSIYKRVNGLLKSLRTRMEAHGVDKEQLSRFLNDPHLCIESPQSIWDFPEIVRLCRREDSVEVMPSGYPDGVGACPPADLLAAYCDGVAGIAERRSVEAHLAECSTCRSVVMETARYLHVALAADAAAPRLWQRRWVVTSAAAVVLLAAGMLLFGELHRRSRPDNSGLAELNALAVALAAEPVRPVEGRISISGSYAPPPSPERGGPREPSPEVRIAAAEIEKLRTIERQRRGARRALGLAYLATGRLDKAVAALQTATADGGVDGRFQTDLSAAYIARAAWAIMLTSGARPSRRPKARHCRRPDLRCGLLQPCLGARRSALARTGRGRLG